MPMTLYLATCHSARSMQELICHRNAESCQRVDLFPAPMQTQGLMHDVASPSPWSFRANVEL